MVSIPDVPGLWHGWSSHAIPLLSCDTYTQTTQKQWDWHTRHSGLQIIGLFMVSTRLHNSSQELGSCIYIVFFILSMYHTVCQIKLADVSAG